MKKYNPLKENFIKAFPDVTFEQCKDKLASNIKFSLKYFDNSQSVGQDFKEWNQKELSELLVSLKEFSNNTISYWSTKKIGHAGNNVLATYSDFPTKSAFRHPKYVPFNARWACFRLERKKRLVGFFIPSGCDFGNTQIDRNTFYIVFLDAHHKFC